MGEILHKLLEMQRTDKGPSTLIDARGLSCPMPLLKAKQALGQVSEGELVRLLATDPGSVRDIQAFIDLSFHSLVSVQQANGCYDFLLCRGVNPRND